MKIAYVHYHLRRGGVTRIVQQALRALAADRFPAVVVTGEPPADPDAFPCPVRVVPELGYDAARPRARSEDLARRLVREAAGALGGPPDLWHLHNHSLGKNAAVPGTVRRLAEQGCRLLLHIHDFAEDGRPENYRRLRDQAAAAGAPPLAESLYPAASHIHYAALNQRDAAVLRAAGVPDGQCHFLPNPVAFPDPDDAPAAPPDPGLILYPTRAIRRKNIGEFLMWAACAEAGDRFAVTLAPENPAARPVYDRWVRFAADHRLPVAFEVGTTSPLPFPALLRTARCVATTSVAEGFGLAFLEPWLADRPLAGRDLPEITGEFREAGVDLEPLYERLDIPAAWVGVHDLRSTLEHALRAARRSYGRATSPDDVDAAYHAAVRTDRVDFGRLNEPLQERVIEHALRSRSHRAQLPPNPFGSPSEPHRIRQNREAIQQTYGIAQYGQRLERIYRALYHAPVQDDVSAHDSERLLEAFLAPARFYLLRT